MLALLPAVASLALRQDAPLVTQTRAERMSPAALADAVLSPGHPVIVEVRLPEQLGILPPPAYVAPLDFGLIGAATFDRASGFCVKHGWRVTGTSAGKPEAISPEPTLYRLPPASGDCEARRSAFFSVAPDDRPRAFTIVRLLADAVARPQRSGATMWTTADVDGPRSARRVEGSEMRSVLAALPMDRVFVVRRQIVTPLLPHEALIGPDGHPRETWELYADDRSGPRMWSIHLALDGDRLAALYLHHAIPAPF